ncbi:ferredoxin [Nocardia arthritidis]|uniref:ferredoxin n=1 Tax=Nocardia arthritidis TaxID=228602 RepID=UPI000A01829E
MRKITVDYDRCEGHGLCAEQAPDVFGVWGTILSGGHALVMGATDSRVTDMGSHKNRVGGRRSACWPPKTVADHPPRGRQAGRSTRRDDQPLRADPRRTADVHRRSNVRRRRARSHRGPDRSRPRPPHSRGSHRHHRAGRRDPTEGARALQSTAGTATRGRPGLPGFTDTSTTRVPRSSTHSPMY